MAVPLEADRAVKSDVVKLSSSYNTEGVRTMLNNLELSDAAVHFVEQANKIFDTHWNPLTSLAIANKFNVTRYNQKCYTKYYYTIFI